MPFSSGTFNLFSTGNPVVTGTTISSSWANSTLSDIASGLSSCVLKDGSQTITGNLPMGGFKFTGLAAGSANGNSVRYEQSPAGIMTAQGDMIYASSANTPAALSKGTAYQFLRMNSGATAPEWNDLDPVTNSLGGNVALNNTGSFFDGPSCAQGTSGTWFASGTVTLTDSAGAAAFIAELWDGTSVIASARADSSGANARVCISLSGFITSPAGNIRISVKDTTSTSGVIAFNESGTLKDSTLTVVRIG